MSEPTKAASFKLAGAAEVDPRTAMRFLRGEKLRKGLQLERLQRAALSLDMTPQPRDEPTAQPEAK